MSRKLTPEARAARKAWGDPRRPESVIVARNLERKKISLWLERWANVRRRNPQDFPGIEVVAAKIVSHLAFQVRWAPGGELLPVEELERKMQKRKKHRASNERYLANKRAREAAADNGNH